MRESWKPAGYPSLCPYLVCNDPEATISFLQSVFHANLVRRHDQQDGSLMHAEVRIDDSIIMIGGLPGADKSEAHVHLYVPDVQATFDRAIAAGGEIVQEPLRNCGGDGIHCGVKGPSGTTWWLATQTPL